MKRWLVIPTWLLAGWSPFLQERYVRPLLKPIGNTVDFAIDFTTIVIIGVAVWMTIDIFIEWATQRPHKRLYL